jgi:hypothetical protein
MQKTRRARHVILGLLACGFMTVLIQGGCAESEDIAAVQFPDGGPTATGGSQATGGQQGSATGGNTQSGGSIGTGGSNGTGGTVATGGIVGTGGTLATGGTMGSGGIVGTGGTRATGGTVGTGGAGGGRATGGTVGTGGTRATGGTVGTGGTGGTVATVTFTQLYQTILTVSCGGSQCHSPGTQGGVSFASQSSAYSAVKGRVVAGNANGSSFYTLLTSGKMPQGAAKLSTTLLNEVAAWINAGALNN